MPDRLAFLIQEITVGYAPDFLTNVATDKSMALKLCYSIT